MRSIAGSNKGRRDASAAKRLPAISISQISVFTCPSVITSSDSTNYKGRFDAYQRTYVISIKERTRLEYRYLLYDLLRKLNELRYRSLGTVTKFLTAKIIRALSLTVPPADVQNEIIKQLDSVEDKITIEEKRKSSLETIFTSLLHQLMTGKVRVKNNYKD